jgi:hypothetical protein
MTIYVYSQNYEVVFRVDPEASVTSATLSIVKFKVLLAQELLGFDPIFVQTIFTKYEQALECACGTETVIITCLRESEAAFLVQSINKSGGLSQIQMVVVDSADVGRLAQSDTEICDSATADKNKDDCGVNHMQMVVFDPVNISYGGSANK